MVQHVKRRKRQDTRFSLGEDSRKRHEFIVVLPLIEVEDVQTISTKVSLLSVVVIHSHQHVSPYVRACSVTGLGSFTIE